MDRRTFLAGAGALLGTEALTPVFASQSPSSLAKIVARVEPSVVMITGITPERASDPGTGFVTKGGIIVTCYHVASTELSAIYVTTKDGRSWPAEVIGQNEATDISILRVSPDATKGIVPLKWGNSDAVMPGDSIFEIGNPYGKILAFTVTSGIVSAIHRDNLPFPLHPQNFIQIDAPTNKGNSGCPVFNADGEVIGMVLSIIGPLVSSGTLNVGVALATPSNEIVKVVTDFEKYGGVKPGIAGVIAVDAIPKNKPIDGLAPPPLSTGVKITKIETGSPGYNRLQVGDVITSFDGKPIRTSNDFNKAVLLSHPGDKIRLGVTRDGKKAIIEMTLGGGPLVRVPLRPRPLAQFTKAQP